MLMDRKSGLKLGEEAMMIKVLIYLLMLQITSSLLVIPKA
jgi:hypothetical protein